MFEVYKDSTISRQRESVKKDQGAESVGGNNGRASGNKLGITIESFYRHCFSSRCAAGRQVLKGSTKLPYMVSAMYIPYVITKGLNQYAKRNRSNF